MKKAIIIIVVFVVVGILLFLEVRGYRIGENAQPTNTATMKRGSISKTIVAISKIEALYKAEKYMNFLFDPAPNSSQFSPISIP